MQMCRTSKALWLASVLALGIAVPATVAAADVEGEVVLPPGGTEEPEPQYLGFVNRIRNPITELRPYDPRGEAFVFLEGGNAEADATKPGRKGVPMNLGISNFEPELLPVVAGSKVVIRNRSRRTHPLYSPDKPDLGEGPPIGAGGERELVLGDAFSVVRLASRDVPHVTGRIVAVPTSYFSTIDRDGTFVIKDVPPGRWTIRVWYRDGWLPVRETVEVGASRGKRQQASVRLTLPERLDTQAPGESGK